MSANELLLLGLLDERSRHGYELHEFLERRLHFVSDLKKPTAYRLLDRLYGEGLVERTLEREGRRPERMVYRLTEAGKARFEELLRDQLVSARPAHSPLNIALLFWDRLAPAERAALLGRRRQDVEAQRQQIVSFIAAHPPGTPARLVLEHDLAHFETELAWLDRILESIESGIDEPAGAESPARADQAAAATSP